MNKRIDILIQTKDRPTEVAMLLESLYYQSYQDFDIFILEDASGTPLFNYHFVNCILNRLKLNGHRIEFKRHDLSLGVSRTRQHMVDWCRKESENEFICRVDDDCVLERDYLERLMKVIDAGFDLASGITPAMFASNWKRDATLAQPFINDIVIDREGNIIVFGDDCGYEYEGEAIIPTLHFRSAALYKKSVHDKISYALHITDSGFREEEFFAFQLIIHGYKLGVDVQAKAWHQMTPSGGDRRQNYNELAMTNHQMMLEYIKKLHKQYGDFFDVYRKQFKTYEEQFK